MQRSEHSTYGPEEPKRANAKDVNLPERQVRVPPVTVFERRGSRTRVRRPLSTSERYLRIAKNHLNKRPDEPLDSKKVLKRLGISAGRLSQIRSDYREAGIEIPLNKREYEQRLRREAGIPKRPSSRALRRSREALREKLIAEKDERRGFDERVRNLYNLRYTYQEIREWLGEEDLSRINHSVERLERRGEVIRGIPERRRKK